MATIRNSISLQDQMTPVLRSIIKSIDSTLKVMQKLDRQAGRGVQSRSYQTAAKHAQQATKQLNAMDKQLKNVDKSASKAGNSMKGLSSWGLNLTGLASGLSLLKQIAQTAQNIMETPDTMNSAEYRLKTFDTTDATSKQLIDSAYAAAQRSRSSWQATSDLASRILISGATKGSGAQAVKMAEILNKASFLGGASSQESERALLQLSQGLASGALQGDELRAIREQAPGLTDTLAKGLSKLAENGFLPEKFIGTTTGDLKQLGADGELTADRIIAAFREMEDYVDATFEDSPKTFGQAMKGIGNVWKRWLTLMSKGDNALARINQAGWDLLEWLESDKGTRFFTGLTKVVNGVVDGIFWLVEQVQNVISWFSDLEDSTEILQSALIGLAGAFAFNVVTSMASFIATSWKVLLVIGMIAVIVYALLKAGYEFSDILGWIAGGLMFIGTVVWDAILIVINGIYIAIGIIWHAVAYVVQAIIDIIAAAIGIILTIIIGIVQVITWIGWTIASVVIFVYDIIYSIIMGIWGVIKGVILVVYTGFVGLAEGVLGILYGIASAIDWVFGSDLAGKVGGWMDGLANSVNTLADKLNIEDTFKDIGDTWTGSFDLIGQGYVESTFADDMVGEVWDSVGFFMDVNGEAGEEVRGMYDLGGMDPLFNAGFRDPVEQWQKGQAWGQNLGDKIENLDLDNKIEDITGMLDKFDKEGIFSAGGDIDKVGKIDSDVDISDEDIKLIRDMVARDFLINLQTVTPTANIKFGDVRETADVNKIMEVIQDMVDEELATSLVVN